MKVFLISIIVLFTVMKYNVALPPNHLITKRIQKFRSPRDTTDITSRSENLQEKSERKNRLFDDDGIVYPENVPKPYLRREVKSEECVFGLCWGSYDYPADKIKQLLNNTGLVDDDSLPRIDPSSVSIKNRFYSDDDEETLCSSKFYTIFPEKANNTQSKPKTIVNVEGHKQGITFETCLDQGQCRFSEMFPNDYVTQCKQKFVTRRLMVFNEKEKFVFDYFQFPSCCVCTIKKTTS